MARGKVLDMKGVIVKTIPEIKRQHWLNKELKEAGHVHIEEWFDDWLDESDDYWRQTYQELLKFESEFYYLKEFVCQIERGAFLSTLHELENNESIAEVFKSAEMLVLSAQSPFEKLLMKWIVADLLYFHRDKHENCYDIDICDFYNKVKVIVLKETEQYPIRIEIKEAYTPSEPGINYVSNKWRLIGNVNQKNTTMETTKNTTETKRLTTEDIIKAEYSTVEEIITRLIVWDDPEAVRKDLREIMDFYLTKTEDNADRREAVYGSFYTMNAVLEKAQPLYDKKYSDKE